MEDVLRWTLFIVGTLAIAGVLIHGLWVSRRSSGKSKSKAQFEAGRRHGVNSERSSEPSFSLDDDSDNAHEQKGGFDDLGVGPVRVVSNHKVAIDETTSEPPLAPVKENQENTAKSFDEDLSFTGQSEQDEPDDSTMQKVSNPSESADIAASTAPKTAPKPPVTPGKVYASVVTQPKPEYTAQQHYTSAGSKPAQEIPEPPTFLLKGNDTAQAPQQPKTAAVAQATQEQAVSPDVAQKVLHTRKQDGASRKRKEPKFTEDQLNIDFDEQLGTSEPSAAEPQRNEAVQKSQAPTQDQPQEVLVLNVKTADDAPIQGAALLPMLLTLGFKFGDQDIFHRHVNANGKGPVLFSLANMFKPGVFDIDNLENFTTHGITLFMILPIEGDPHQVFNMMHNATRKIADEFNAQILDGRRSMLTKQGLQQYVERIREFERKRMIHR